MLSTLEKFKVQSYISFSENILRFHLYDCYISLKNPNTYTHTPQNVILYILHKEKGGGYPF